jgi:hypothetical protein
MPEPARHELTRARPSYGLFPGQAGMHRLERPVGGQCLPESRASRSRHGRCYTKQEPFNDVVHRTGSLARQRHLATSVRCRHELGRLATEPAHTS